MKASVDKLIDSRIALHSVLADLSGLGMALKILRKDLQDVDQALGDGDVAKSDRILRECWEYYTRTHPQKDWAKIETTIEIAQKFGTADRCKETAKSVVAFYHLERFQTPQIIRSPLLIARAK